MERPNDYFSIPEEKIQQRSSWNGPWQNTMSPWQAEMPLWQYTTAALTHEDNTPISYYPPETPISPSYTNPSSIRSTLDSPTKAGFRETNPNRFPHSRPHSQPLTPLYDQSQQHGSGREMLGKIEDDIDADEDSDTYSWQPKAEVPRAARPQHRRSHSANELSVKNAKRAHTVVEKNYRERLNDKINDLALYLFETSSDSRTKPSKSLVMTRAKERLKQLESRNKSLENEVVKLRQQIAILDHVVAASGGVNAAGSLGPTLARSNETMAEGEL